MKVEKAKRKKDVGSKRVGHKKGNQSATTARASIAPPATSAHEYEACNDEADEVVALGEADAAAYTRQRTQSHIEVSPSNALVGERNKDDSQPAH